MAANTPPKPHTEGMEWTNEETGIKYQFSGGAWRAVSSSASEEVAEAIDNLDLQKVLDTGNVADKGATFGGKVIVEPGTEGNEAVTYNQLITPTFDDVLQEGNVADTEATFKQPVTINVLQSVEQPFIIKGIANTGTANSNVLFVQNVSTPANRTSVRYRGLTEHDYDIANKQYIDEQISNISDTVPEEVFDVRGKKDVVCTANTSVSWNTAVSGEVRGIYTSGTVKNVNRYVGNWNYAIIVHKDDYDIHGDFSSENSPNRGVLEIVRNKGSSIIFKGVIKRTYTDGDSLIFLVEHNLFGFGDVLSTDSSSDSVGVDKKCRFYFYTL